MLIAVESKYKDLALVLMESGGEIDAPVVKSQPTTPQQNYQGMNN